MDYTEEKTESGYIRAVPTPSTDVLAQHYAEKYYQEANGTYAPEYLPEELRHFHNIAEVARATAEKFGIERSLLDLGCGEGFFAAAFQNFGWDVYCCDYSDFGLTKHNPFLLDRFTPGDIYGLVRTYSAQGLRVGMLNLQNVLEHVIDPELLLVELKPLIADKGAVRIRVPNDYSAFQNALVESGHANNTWFAPPEHLSYFNKVSLKNILEQCGYRLLSVQADFPIEVFLANPHSNYWKDRSVGKGAHLARVFCENHLIESGIAAYIDYACAAGALGFGRELIAYAEPC